MTEDNEDLKNAIAAQNQEAANSDPNDLQPSAVASAENLAAPTLSSDASLSSGSSKTVLAIEGGSAVGELSTSGLAGVLAGADNQLSAGSTVGDASQADMNFINDPASQQPSTAGTSGQTDVKTGMALDVSVNRLAPLDAAQEGANLGIAANVNVVAVGAPHPIVEAVQQRTKELKAIVANQERTPWIERALKDLQTFEEWVVQHFEELRRKM